jgi:3' terminal RNA ribose 2'-O-methyltransferase Hen1
MVRFSSILLFLRKESESITMQLAIKVKGPHAQMVSYLLAKNPANLYERKEKEATVRLVYSRFEEEQVDVFLYAEPDPIALIRNSPDAYDITSYINDREFAVSSLFLTYIRSALGTAINGKPQEEYKKWVDHAFDIELQFGPVATQLKEETIEALFAPMGYTVSIEYGNIDYAVKMKEQSSAKYLSIQGKQTLQNALKHILVLIPVLDNYKHYFIDEREIEKLNRHGEGWLEEHPLRNLILKRALRYSPLVHKSKFELLTDDNKETKEPNPPKVRLNDLRYEAIIDVIQRLPKKGKVVDFGSGEGKLSTRLGFLAGVQEILAVEPSQKSQIRALQRFEKAKRDVGFVAPTPIFGSLFYADDRLRQKDVMILCEVMEHINEHRLPSVFQTIFTYYQPSTLIVTTPNREYNQVYEMQKKFRHSDHRFEWTRAQFASWCESWTANDAYSFSIIGIGEEHEQFGFPTQMAVFTSEERKNNA